MGVHILGGHLAVGNELPQEVAGTDELALAVGEDVYKRQMLPRSTLSFSAL